MRNLFLFLIALFLISCNSGVDKRDSSLGYTVIDVGSDVSKGRVVDISEIASNITYIPLESNAESFIGRAPVVFFENERIYVKSSGAFKVFDKSGKYLFTFDRRGRGPEEYINSQPKVEKGTGNFYADHSKGGGNYVIKSYSRDGNYLKEIPIPSVQSRYLYLNKSIPNCYAFRVSSDTLPGIPGIQIDVDEISNILIDSLSNIIGYVPNVPVDSRLVLNVNREKTPPKGKQFLNPLNDNSIIQALHFFKDTIRIYDFYTDTIFSFVDNSRLIPRYVMDYGKYTPSKIYQNQVSGNLITLDYQFYYETDKFLLLNFLLRDYAHEPFYGKKSYFHVKEREITDAYGYYNKETNKFTFLNHPKECMPGFRDDIAEGPPFVPTYLSYDNYMITLCFAHTLIEYASNNEVSDPLRKIIDALKDDSNPIAILVKLK